MKHLLLSTALLFAATQVSLAETPRETHRAMLDRANIGGHGIAYLDLGHPDDPAVMLLHGIPTSSYLYRDVAPRIAAAGYRVIVPDLLGHGASDRPDDMAVYATEARAARMLELADSLGIERFALVLHDVGGMTGWSMVGQAPERLTSIAATNTLAGLDGVTPAPLVMQMMAGQVSPMDAFADLDDPAVAREMAQMWMDQGYSGPGTAPAQEVDAYGMDLVGAGAAYSAFFGMAVPAFMQGGEALAADLAAYDGPTAIIFGEQDGFFAPDIVIPDLAAKLGTDEGDITRITDAGHFLQTQAPDAYVAALTAFLNNNLEN
ncbi:alpha/beta fold hydrolase [Sulfitobacter sp. M368]|uniref:alpha/beta fold hydrolase n=1 Tax=Sulfitobacter sp. M368 TaxID=2867021 RepID=UPI0021A6AF87|nr:alpha/beta hydrolase [Sulfitobacter sp. M368]UWR14895.1 alpha/beta fold hydrolase [Sulfitobacter sp. M368]